MVARGEGMVDVELVDGEPSEPGDAPPRRRRAWGWGPPRRRLLVASVALLVVVAAGVVFEQVQMRQDDARVAGFQDVPLVVGSLREPPVELWRTPEVLPSAGGLVLTTTGSGSTVSAREIEDGTVRWSRAFPDVDALGCGAATEGGALLICDRNGQLVLDAADGRTVREVGRADAWTVVGDDLVRLAVDGSDLVIRRSDAATGAVRWTSEIPGLLPDEPVQPSRLSTSAGLVTVTGGVAAAVDAEDGTVLAARAAEPTHRATAVASSSGFVLGTSDAASTWFDRQGRPGAELPGAPVTPVVDDGGTAGLVLVQDEAHLRAVDVMEGAVLWQRPAVGRMLLRLEDRVLLEATDEVTAVDLRTGEVVWSVPRNPLLVGRSPMPITDGVRVLLLEYDIARGYLATAYDLDDGQRRWTMPLPEGTQVLTVADADGGFVVAGWSPVVLLGRR